MTKETMFDQTQGARGGSPGESLVARILHPNHETRLAGFFNWLGERTYVTRSESTYLDIGETRPGIFRPSERLKKIRGGETPHH